MWETFREESIDVKLKLVNVDRLTANVFHMWSWAFSCFKMLNTSSPSGSWSNCNSITCTRRNYSAMLFTVKIKYQMITLPHLQCLEEGFQWKSPCLRLFEPSVRSEVVQWEWGVLGNCSKALGRVNTECALDSARRYHSRPISGFVWCTNECKVYEFKFCACTFSWEFCLGDMRGVYGQTDNLDRPIKCPQFLSRYVGSGWEDKELNDEQRWLQGRQSNLQIKWRSILDFFIKPQQSTPLRRRSRGKAWSQRS